MATATQDIGLFESGNGGDIAVLNNDIMLSEQLYQQAYLCLFGGNVEAVTRGDEPAGKYRQDWWGNSLLFGTVKSKQFNSATERALRENALNSAGRVSIIRAVESDLAPLKSIATVAVDAAIQGVNKITISISLAQPAAKTATLQLIWDNAKGEMIIDRII